jgi:hypothetical protein
MCRAKWRKFRKMPANSFGGVGALPENMEQKRFEAACAVGFGNFSMRSAPPPGLNSAGLVKNCAARAA